MVLGVLGFNAGGARLGPLNAMLMLNLIPIGVFAIEAALGRSFARDRDRRRGGGDRRAGREQPLLARSQHQPLNAVGLEPAALGDHRHVFAARPGGGETAGNAATAGCPTGRRNG